MTEHYDVIIVGGRPAGATLAARLGKQGLRVLLLERATFPSQPAASSPIIYAPTMQLLDEIGADEGFYAQDTPRIRRVVAAGKTYTGTIRLPEAHGRDYAYAIDRARFDAALWTNALRFPTVEGRQHFGVTHLVWDGTRVVGVKGNPSPQPPPRVQRGGEEKKKSVEEIFTADVVVGADGRYSTVAQKVAAKVFDEHTSQPTSLYYAYWKGARPYDDFGATAVAYEGGLGYGFLVMDSADGRTLIGIEGRADLLNPPPKGVEAFYLDFIRRNPDIAERIENAEMITDVAGIRRVGNLYRSPGGAGWALVGDAYHQHDPLDGQGIYNAVFTAKVLAWAIRYWKSGEKSWAEAMAWYDETARSKTYGRYRAALDSVQQSIYNPEIPGWALGGLRWVIEDPTMQDLFGKLLTRQLPPEVINLLTPPALVGAILRGPLRDLRKRLAGF
ncbi:MAG: NAD(P)/FAD-dependent oxidoreductase [Chloroflexota bacterium]